MTKKIIKKEKCIWCLKKYDREEFVAKTGILKGQTIVDCYCSEKCGKLMDAMLKTCCMLEDLEEIKKKMRGRRK